MAKIKLGRGEVVLADMAPPLRGVIFPFLELIIATALFWMLIGWMDTAGMDAGIRNANAEHEAMKARLHNGRDAA